MNDILHNQFFSILKRAYHSLNEHLGLEDAGTGHVSEIAPTHALDSCEAFRTLEEMLETARVRQGGRVRLLSLRPPGEVNLPIARVVWQDVLEALYSNAIAAGANSICFSTYINDGYLWIAVTDNGWGFPASVREKIAAGHRLGTGLSFVYDTLRALGGGFRIGSPRAGAEVILRIPIAVM